MFKRFLTFIREINTLSTHLDDIKCFYNYKSYSISIMRSGHPTLRLEAGEEVVDKQGNYVVDEWLFEQSVKNQICRKMKTDVDKMIKQEESATTISDTLEIEKNTEEKETTKKEVTKPQKKNITKK